MNHYYLSSEEEAELKAWMPTPRQAIKYWLLTGTDEQRRRIEETNDVELIDEIRKEILKEKEGKEC